MTSGSNCRHLKRPETEVSRSIEPAYQITPAKLQHFPENRHKRSESEHFRCFPYDELLKRDKVNLDIFWLKDESLEDSANLPDPDVLALEIAEELEAALEQFAAIAEDLKR